MSAGAERSGASLGGAGAARPARDRRRVAAPLCLACSLAIVCALSISCFVTHNHDPDMAGGLN